MLSHNSRLHYSLLYLSYYNYSQHHSVPNMANVLRACQNRYTQQTKLYYRNIIIILSFALFNISSAYNGNITQENTTFILWTFLDNIIWTFDM